ncbi:hypothetical protein VNI00_005269 [Paramarasmius palmivorus]|uniref:Calcineurin-like phosphoesterase domain-containing protein n=1 Tax=Paramarasmius palmivorus TaxID=297713 RepID=A0AAW0DDN3_9AGAR
MSEPEIPQEPTLETPTTRIYTDYPGYAPKKSKHGLDDLGPTAADDGTPVMIEGPPHPGKEWTRFVCISDTHSESYPIPRGDVLLHSGDLSSWGQADQLRETIDWIASLEGFQLCLDAEWCKRYSQPSKGLSIEEREYEEAKRIITDEQLMKGIHYLEHEAYEFTTPEGKQWKVYGSPAAPQHALGAFQYRTDAEAKGVYNLIPRTTEILLTHTPPYRILDKTRKGKHAGCRVLKDKLESGKLRNLKLHVFGHIHEASGAAIMENGGVEVNAAVAWGAKPIIVDLKN